ncbi:hypothetical protein B4168_2641 [Anoxybacillus flavithermus]|nr:hypothetical protein B4168_2641 [Anoxybacillus flavithermus]OAO87405.1 hypothetical protein GT23_1054 [Parageobacillus thermoglucosidasius]
MSLWMIYYAAYPVSAHTPKDIYLSSGQHENDVITKSYDIT